MRQIVLDTETTGLSTAQGHRVIEIGCIEIVNRRLTGREYHRFVNPERDIDEGAERVHGISRADLEGQPRFADIAADLVDYLRGAELIIHNAPFDVAFLNVEFRRLGPARAETLDELCLVTDTLVMARRAHPGQRNSLDALCKRYGVNNAHRDLHGALLDSEILADVYLAMTGGQVSLCLDGAEDGVDQAESASAVRRLSPDRPRLAVHRAGAEELAAHASRLQGIDKASNGGCLWLKGGG